LAEAGGFRPSLVWGRDIRSGRASSARRGGCAALENIGSDFPSRSCETRHFLHGRGEHIVPHPTLLSCPVTATVHCPTLAHNSSSFPRQTQIGQASREAVQRAGFLEVSRVLREELVVDGESDMASTIDVRELLLGPPLFFGHFVVDDVMRASADLAREKAASPKR
jgi:hypothetical protein